MKRNYFFVFFISAILCWGCSKNDDNNTDASSANTAGADILTTGTWKVTYAYYDSTDHSADFNEFRFLFDKNGHSTAANTLFSVNGTWSANNNNSPANITLDYPDADGPQCFIKISGTYTVISKTVTRIEMRKINAGLLSNDALVLEKV